MLSEDLAYFGKHRPRVDRHLAAGEMRKNRTVTPFTKAFLKKMSVGIDMYALLYLKWITNRPTVEHRELCSMLCGSLDERGLWGRMDTCICMAESLCCAPETITTLLIGCTPM